MTLRAKSRSAKGFGTSNSFLVRNVITVDTAKTQPIFHSNYEVFPEALNFVQEFVRGPGNRPFCLCLSTSFSTPLMFIEKPYAG